LRYSNITLCLVVFFGFIGSVAYSAYDDTQDIIREHYLRGNLYYQQGKYKEADEEYKKAIDLANLQPKKIEAVKAKEVSKQAMAVKPQQPEKVILVKSAVADDKKNAQKDSFKQIGFVKSQFVHKADRFLIGEDDNLHISVWQNPDMEQDVIVRPDGMISYPLVGDIQAAGLSIPELAGVITKKLEEFIKYPEVSISLKRMGGARVMVLGQVNSPGIYAVTGARTIMEAIAMAGSLTRDSVPSSTVLIRGGFNAPNIQRINVAKIFKGDLRQNVILQSQDIVFVPRKFISDLSYFLNQILDPLSKGATTYKDSQTWGQSQKLTISN
jgi:polysaccharide export outer membrane protein